LILQRSAFNPDPRTIRSQTTKTNKNASQGSGLARTPALLPAKPIHNVKDPTLVGPNRSPNQID